MLMEWWRIEKEGKKNEGDYKELLFYHENYASHYLNVSYL